MRNPTKPLALMALPALLLLAGPAAADEPAVVPAFQSFEGVAPEDWFDFYAGRWSFDSEGFSGVVTVELFDDQNIMRSLFEGTAGGGPYFGAGVAIYDAARGVWDQRFVEGSGRSLDVTYVAQGEGLVGQYETFENGRRIVHRFTFHDVTPDSFKATISYCVNGQDTFTDALVVGFTRMPEEE